LFLRRYATIDIGSNTILLLIGQITPEGNLEVVLDIEETTRLGKGLQRGGRLDPCSVRKTISALKRFISLCQRKEVEKIAAVGTNALRLATDAEQFIQAVQKECGISPQIITGKDEAYLSFLAVERDPAMPRDVLVMDVGGGSTEYIFRRGEDQHLQPLSLPLGAVNLTEEFLHSDPPSQDEVMRLQGKIEKSLHHLPLAAEGELVGIGGTAVTLACAHLGQESFNRQKIHGLPMSIDERRNLVKELQRKDLEARKKIKGLPPERADIILAGAIIILSSMERMGKEKIRISCHGLRYGLFYQRFMS